MGVAHVPHRGPVVVRSSFAMVRKQRGYSRLSSSFTAGSPAPIRDSASPMFAAGRETMLGASEVADPSAEYRTTRPNHAPTRGRGRSERHLGDGLRLEPSGPPARVSLLDGGQLVAMFVGF